MRSRRAASRWRDPSGRRRGRDRHRQQLGAAADRGGGPRPGARAGPGARRHAIRDRAPPRGPARRGCARPNPRRRRRLRGARARPGRAAGVGVRDRRLARGRGRVRRGGRDRRGGRRAGRGALRGAGGGARLRGRGGRGDAAPGRRRGRAHDGAHARRGRAGHRRGEPAARRARADGGARRGPGRGACGRGGGPRGEGAAGAGAHRRRPPRRLGRHGDRARRARPRPRRVRAAPRARTCARPHRARGAHRPPRAHDRRRARAAPGARSRARGDPARRRARAGAGRRRTRRRPDRRERSRRAPCLPARGPRARRPTGRLRGALAMTADELARAIAASGVRDTARVAEAARAVAGWLARAPADEVAEGLAAAADPGAALDQLARLLPAAEAPPAPGRVAPLLRLLGGSPALAAALVAEGAAWPALVAAVHEVPALGPDAQRAALAAAGAAGPLSRADLQAALRRHRRRELVRIGGRDLLGLASVEDTVRAVGTVDGRVVRADRRLRPGGGEGPAAVGVPAARACYEAGGQTWERAAWLKARAVGGDRALGERLVAGLMPFVYRRYLDFGTLEDLKAMKRRVDASLRGPQAARDVKLGRGGIREVEFFVQAQQLVHGGKDPRVAVRGSLGALAALAATGYVEPALAVSLAAAYRFLRDVEHKLQIVQERRTQSVPSDPDALLALARRLGFRGAGAAAEFEAARARHGAVVRGAFAALFHGAEEERRREAEPELALLIDELGQPERALWRLGRLGFRDLESAYRELRLLRDGPPHAPASARRRAALVRLAPALLTEISRSAAPERALHHLATFVSTIGARTSYLHLLLENPGVMRLLVRLFATSEFLSAFF